MQRLPALFTAILLFLFTLQSTDAQIDGSDHGDPDSTTTVITYLPGPMILTEDLIEENQNTRIVSIEFEGLTRISSRALIESIELSAGDRIKALDIEKLRMQLFKTGLFESVKLYYQPTGQGYRINIKVKEHPHLKLVPYFSLSRGAVITGGATVDSKIKSSESTLLGTTVWQRGGLTGKMGYVNPQLYDGNGTFSLFFSGGYDEIIHSYADGTEVRNFSGYTGQVISKLEVNQNRRIQPAGLLEYEMLELTSGWDPLHELPDSSEMLGVGISLSYDTTYYIFYFREGSRITAQLSRGFIIGPRTGNLMGNLTLQRTFHRPVRRNLKLFCKTGFNFTDPLHYNQMFGSGFRILPNEETVDRLYFTSAAEYELPLSEPSFGTLSGYGFFEGGYYSPIEASHEFFLGPGVGFRFYIQRVEEPILGFHLGFNTVSLTARAEFFFGIQY
ncbi:MAG: POTRA domain-containing protein [Spirochaetota bacterium]